MKPENFSIHDLLQTIKKLRDPEKGCPWDKKQTHDTLKPYFIEETYEALEAIDELSSEDEDMRNNSYQKLKEELGDVLLQILLHSELAEEKSQFSFLDVAQSIHEKMVRRHPHVFSDVMVSTSEEVVKNWEKIKQTESKEKKKTVLSGVPHALPALLRAHRTIEKVTQVGFQWPDLEGPLQKMEEELEEFKQELKNREHDPKNYPLENVENELGDLLFTIANLAYLQGLNAEEALRKALQKFQRRFDFVEKKVLETGKKLEESNLKEMDQYWDEAKKLEKTHSS